MPTHVGCVCLLLQDPGDMFRILHVFSRIFVKSLQLPPNHVFSTAPSYSSHSIPIWEANSSARRLRWSILDMVPCLSFSSIFLMVFFRASVVCGLRASLSSASYGIRPFTKVSTSVKSASVPGKEPSLLGSQSIPRSFSLPSKWYPIPSPLPRPSLSPSPHYPTQSTNKDPQQSCPLP